MTKLTPYGRAIAITGIVLIACTVALVYLFTRPQHANTAPDPDLDKRVAQLQDAVELYRRDAWQKSRENWALNDSIKAMRAKVGAQSQNIDQLKRQANEAKNMDYRRFTNDELAGILSTRYDTTAGR